MNAKGISNSTRKHELQSEDDAAAPNRPRQSRKASTTAANKRQRNIETTPPKLATSDVSMSNEQRS